MVEGPSISPGSNSLNQIRRERLEQRDNGRTEKNVPQNEGDRFEPSSALSTDSATEAAAQSGIGVNPDDGGQEGAENREDRPDPIANAEEAGALVTGIREQIGFNAEAAVVAQGNLDQETILSLIA